MRLAAPLKWPEGQSRTKIRERVDRKAWKKPSSVYEAELQKELKLFGAVNIVVTANEDEKRDPGVAVWFALPPAADDGEWQDILGIETPTPTVELISQRAKELRLKFHPDNQTTGNMAEYMRVDEARKKALAWTTGDFGEQYQKAIGSDKYKSIRENLKALAVALAAIRKVEESGVTGIIERVFGGFNAPQIGEGRGNQTAA